MPANDEPTPTDDEDQRLVERLALVLADAGIPRMPARVLARLLVDDESRLTARDLAVRLSVSPAAISGAVRYLLQTSLIERHREPGARADHYRLPRGDLWAETFVRRLTVIEQWERAMGEGARALGPGRPGTRRLRESQAFFAFMREDLTAMTERWRAHKDAFVAEVGDESDATSSTGDGTTASR